jgi:hypothetical protein
MAAAAAAAAAGLASQDIFDEVLDWVSTQTANPALTECAAAGEFQGQDLTADPSVPRGVGTPPYVYRDS